MARDYTKYNVEGLGENLNKRKLVFTIVKDWVEKNNPSFEELQKAFPDEVQGSKGFIRKEADVKTPKHFNMREPLKIKNGAHVVVSNQWGENIEDFIESVKKLGYKVTATGSESSKKQDISESSPFPTKNANPEEISNYIEKIILSKDEKKCKLFNKSVIDFINENHNCYWIIPFSNAILGELEYKNDDENLGIEDLISDMRTSGKELNFNPKSIFSIYYHEYEMNFQIEEDDDENSSFFNLISDNFLQLNIEEFKSFTPNEHIEFYDTSMSVLYCTICKMCEENIRQDELVDLLLSVFNDPISSKFEIGDEIWNIIENTLKALRVDLEEYEEEWNGYRHNWPSIANYLIDNDVFDDDYIPS